LINIIDCTVCRAPVYFGPDISGKSLIEEYKQFKTSQKIPYNLENDDLFGRPLNTEWEEIKKYL